MIFVPPGGFQGFAAQSIATRSLLQRVVNPRRRKAKPGAPRKRVPTRKRIPGGPVTRKRRPAKKRVARRRRSGAKPARLVKGSAAAKRHMAKLRRMRK